MVLHLSIHAPIYVWNILEVKPGPDNPQQKQTGESPEQAGNKELQWEASKMAQKQQPSLTT